MRCTMKKIIKYSLFSYLFYVFIFSFLIYFYPSKENKEITNEFSTEQVNTLSDNHELALIEKAEDAISVRLDLIENAESQIDLAYYRWADGEVSDLMLGSILEAADRGVEIRILLDGIVQLTNFNQGIEDIFLAFKNHPNIDIRLYEPFNPLVPIAWNHRMHDKMILVDQRFALTGGRNIQDRFYIEDADLKGLVQDREVLIYNEDKNEKTVINQMEDYYEELWNYKHTKEKFKRMTKREEEKGKEQLDKLRLGHSQNKNNFLEKHFPNFQAKDWTTETIKTDDIYFVSNSFGRMNQKPIAARALLNLAEEADESIFIQSPYFVPSNQMLKEAENYDAKAEITTLFTNSEAASPNILAMAAYKNHRQDLVDTGAQIVEYQGPGSTHAKSSIFDEEISVIGTFNIDPRSTYLNTESMVIINSKEFAEDLKGAIAVDFENSLKVGNDYNYLLSEKVKPSSTSFLRKLMIRLLSFFAPLFEKLL